MDHFFNTFESDKQRYLSQLEQAPRETCRALIKQAMSRFAELDPCFFVTLIQSALQSDYPDIPAVQRSASQSAISQMEVAEKIIGQAEAIALLEMLRQAIMRARHDQISLFTKAIEELFPECITYLAVGVLAAPFLGLKTLRQAIDLWIPPDQVSKLHVEYLKLAILSKSYYEASKFVSFDRLKPFQFTSNFDMAVYCYYSALAFIGTKEFVKARQFLTACSALGDSKPGNIRGICFDAALKLNLLDLILSDGVDMKRGLEREMKTKEGAAYAIFTNSWKSGQLDDVRKVLNDHQNAFVVDGNLGLCKQACEALNEKLVLRIARIYTSVTIEELQRHVGTDVRVTLERMVSQKKLRMKYEVTADGQQIVYFEKQQPEFWESQPNVEVGLTELVDKAVRIAEQLNQVKGTEAYLKLSTKVEDK